MYSINESITWLSEKNKKYRLLNEGLIARLNMLAAEQEAEEIKQGIPEEERIISQRIKRRSAYIMACGTFIKIKNINGKCKITSGNFCRDKLCALCQKARAVKRYAQMLNVLNDLRKDKVIYSENNVIIGMVTLTQKNVKLDKLYNEITKLSTGIKRLTQRKKWKESIIGWAKSLEITYNKEDRTFHPHYHFLIVWDTSKSLHSIDIQNLWKSSLKVDYFPQCEITQAYGENANITNIINECLKYNIKVAKKEQGAIYDDLSLSEFKTFLKIMKGKRLVSYGGIIQDYRNKLQYTDEETDKGINIDLQKNIILPSATNELILQWSNTKNKYEVLNHDSN